MANKDKCKNIKDPKQRAACLAGVKDASGGGVEGRGLVNRKGARKRKPREQSGLK